MPRTRARVALAAGLLVLIAALPSAAAGDGRIPVNSVDSATSPTANRIDAVANIVRAMNARLDRVSERAIVRFPPNPCDGVTEPGVVPACDAAVGVVLAYLSLGQSVAEACTGDGFDGPGDAVISDADAFAADTSETGIANQLEAIATVLGNADDRLGGILLPDPGPPEVPVAAALNALSEAIFDGGSAAVGLTGGDYFPPNPCAVP